MTGGIDGDHVLEAEVPLEVGVQEGNHKCARGSVHMDFDVPAVLLIQLAWNSTPNLPDARATMQILLDLTS